MCVHNWDELWTKNTKRPKKPPETPKLTATYEDPEQKQGTTAHAPPHTPPPNGWAKHLSHRSGPTPGHTPTIIPYKEPAHRPQGVSKGTLLVIAPP